jgi:hypothetical protein
MVVGVQDIGDAYCDSEMAEVVMLANVPVVDRPGDLAQRLAATANLYASQRDFYRY